MRRRSAPSGCRGVTEGNRGSAFRTEARETAPCVGGTAGSVQLSIPAGGKRATRGKTHQIPWKAVGRICSGSETSTARAASPAATPTRGSRLNATPGCGGRGEEGEEGEAPRRGPSVTVRERATRQRTVFLLSSPSSSSNVLCVLPGTQTRALTSQTLAFTFVVET